MKTEKGFIYDIEKGKGSMKYYKYWVNGYRIYTKEDIVKAINSTFNIMRKDKIDGLWEIFDYKSLSFMGAK